MFFVKISGVIQEFVFDTKKDSLQYIVDFLARQDFDNPKKILKDSVKYESDDLITLTTNEHKFEITKLFKYEKCCICEEPISSNKGLDCDHFICCECLNKLRQTQCPICRKEISGKIVTDEILCRILTNFEKDVQQEENNNQVMAFLASLGHDINELY